MTCDHTTDLDDRLSVWMAACDMLRSINGSKSDMAEVLALACAFAGVPVQPPSSGSVVPLKGKLSVVEPPDESA